MFYISYPFIILYNQSLARKLCLSDTDTLVGILGERSHNIADNSCYRQLAKLENGKYESSRLIKKRMI